MVHAAYQTHLGQDYFFAPRATLADGIIWLLMVKAGITRANLVQVRYVVKQAKGRKRKLIRSHNNTHRIRLLVFIRSE